MIDVILCYSALLFISICFLSVVGLIVLVFYKSVSCGDLGVSLLGACFSSGMLFLITGLAYKAVHLAHGG